MDTALIISDSEKDYKRYQLYYSKENISSGSIFKLDKDFNKAWEVKFKGKRVTHILLFDSSSFIVAGERIDMKVIWVARMRMSDGALIWMKECKAGRKLETSGATIANGNIYVLGAKERVIPLRIKTQYGRLRVLFFRTKDMRANLLVLCVSGKGRLRWKRNLETEKQLNFFGDEIVPSGNLLYALGNFHGFKHQHRQWVKKEGTYLFSFNQRGRNFKKSLVDANDMFYIMGKSCLAKILKIILKYFKY
ncbi:MAG TPA: hypothetical protein VMU83_21850 [Hanamia sp.]|nr:hypothetical protein [Hanamia sp.]